MSGLLVVGAWVLGFFVILMLIGWGLPYLDTPIERVRALASRDAPPSREPTLGRIYVESPEVYTRQRLVNDRFAQDAWLRDQMRELDDDANTFIQQVLQSDTGLRLAIGAGMSNLTGSCFPVVVSQRVGPARRLMTATRRPSADASILSASL